MGTLLGGLALGALLLAMLGTISSLLIESTTSMTIQLFIGTEASPNGWFTNFNILSGDDMAQSAKILQEVFLGESGSFLSVIMTLAWIMFAISLIAELFKLFGDPGSGARTPSVGRVFLKFLIFAFFLGNCYSISEYILRWFTRTISMLSTMAVSDLRGFISTWKPNLFDDTNLLTNLNDPGWYVFFCILACGMSSQIISCLITYIERYIGFAIYVYLGPMCVAMGVNDSTQDVTKKWVMGLIGQMLAIALSIMLIVAGYKALISTPIVSTTTQGADIMGEGSNQIVANSVSLILATVFFSAAKNAEKFFNLFGFSTMNYGDAARTFTSGMVQAAAAARTAMGLGSSIAHAAKPSVDKARNSGAQKTKNGEYRAGLLAKGDTKKGVAKINDMAERFKEKGLSGIAKNIAGGGKTDGMNAKLNQAIDAKTEAGDILKQKIDGYRDSTQKSQKAAEEAKGKMEKAAEAKSNAKANRDAKQLNYDQAKNMNENCEYAKALHDVQKGYDKDMSRAKTEEKKAAIQQRYDNAIDEINSQMAKNGVSEDRQQEIKKLAEMDTTALNLQSSQANNAEKKAYNELNAAERTLSNAEKEYGNANDNYNRLNTIAQNDAALQTQFEADQQALAQGSNFSGDRNNLSQEATDYLASCAQYDDVMNEAREAASSDRQSLNNALSDLKHMDSDEFSAVIGNTNPDRQFKSLGFTIDTNGNVYDSYIEYDGRTGREVGQYNLQIPGMEYSEPQNGSALISVENGEVAGYINSGQTSFSNGVSHVLSSSQSPKGYTVSGNQSAIEAEAEFVALTKQNDMFVSTGGLVMPLQELLPKSEEED